MLAKPPLQDCQNGSARPSLLRERRLFLSANSASRALRIKDRANHLDRNRPEQVAASQHSARLDTDAVFSAWLDLFRCIGRRRRLNACTLRTRSDRPGFEYSGPQWAGAAEELLRDCVSTRSRFSTGLLCIWALPDQPRRQTVR